MSADMSKAMCRKPAGDGRLHRRCVATVLDRTTKTSRQCRRAAETGTAHCGAHQQTIVGKLIRHPDRPERLALMRANGKISNWFARDQTRAFIAVILAQYGLKLQDDDTVTQGRANR